MMLWGGERAQEVEMGQVMLQVSGQTALTMMLHVCYDGM
jgi:hypothetical protein